VKDDKNPSRKDEIVLTKAAITSHGAANGMDGVSISFSHNTKKLLPLQMIELSSPSKRIQKLLRTDYKLLCLTYKNGSKNGV
jgi:hypothetical protein